MNIIKICCLLFVSGISVSTTYASEWNIFACAITGGATVEGQKNPGSGLMKISQDGKTVINMGFDNITTFNAAIYPDNDKNLIYTANHNGFFVTKNNGKKWRVTSDHKITEVQEVVADIKNPATVYCGTSYGLFKSTEYGENLKKLTDRFVSSLVTDSKNNQKLYMGQENGLFITEDGGNTFNKVHGFDYYIDSITQSPFNNKKFYVGTENNGIFISNDSCKTFSQCNGIAAKDAVYCIVIDNKNTDLLYAGTHKNGVIKSEDGGKTWKSFNKGIEKCYAIYCIAINPDNADTLYAGTTHGIFVSKDAGGTWEPFAMSGAHVQHLYIIK